MKNLFLYQIGVICLLSILIFANCENNIDGGKYTPINWEIIFNKNLDFKFVKGNLEITAIEPGNIELIANNSKDIGFAQIKLNNDIQIDPAKYSEDFSIYEDDYIQIILNKINYNSKNGSAKIIVKNIKSEANYRITLLGDINVVSTIKLSIRP